MAGGVSMVSGRRKRKGRRSAPFAGIHELRGGLSQEMIVISGPVGQDGRIENLAAAGALPGIEGSYVVIELFIEHAAFAPGTFHCRNPPESNKDQ